MAATSLTTDSSRLKDVYERGLKLHLLIQDGDEPSNTESVQKNINSAINCFTQCTEMVNQLSLFSCNEEIDEVPTADLRYLLLPAYLGDLTLSKMSSERVESITTAKVYCIDYLKDVKIIELQKSSNGSLFHRVSAAISKIDLQDISIYCESCESMASERKGLQQMEESRQSKIARYKHQKQQEQKLKELNQILCDTGQSADDDTQREYSIILLKVWINKCIEHLSSIESELEILEHMEKMRKQNGGKIPEREKPPPRPPMKPVLITREMLKSKVFGAGYQSLPTMSQEELFQKEVREGKIVMEYKSDSKERNSENEEEEKKKAMMMILRN